MLRIPEIHIASMEIVLVMPRNTGKKYIRSCNKRSEFLSHFMFFKKSKFLIFVKFELLMPAFRVARVDMKGINIIGFELALKTGSERTNSPPAIFLNIGPPVKRGPCNFNGMLFNRDISISHKKLNDANCQLSKPPQKTKIYPKI